MRCGAEHRRLIPWRPVLFRASGRWLAYHPIRGFSCPFRTLSLGTHTKRSDAEIISHITVGFASAAKKSAPKT